jgi:hypothetical protein
MAVPNAARAPDAAAAVVGTAPLKMARANPAMIVAKTRRIVIMRDLHVEGILGPVAQPLKDCSPALGRRRKAEGGLFLY